MAGTVLRRRAATVWLPPRALGERAFGSDPVLHLAMSAPPRTRSGGAATGEEAAGCVRSSLDSLPALDRVTLIFDARDVNLLRVAVPPLSSTRMRQAIPNLIEESLLQDVQDCACAVGPLLDDGRRLVAVIDRAWLEFVLAAFARRGIRVRAAWPAQLALPTAVGGFALAGLDDGLAVRTGLMEGFGWSAGTNAGTSVGTSAAARSEAIAQVLARGVRAQPDAKRLSVFDRDGTWQAAVLDVATKTGLSVDFQPAGSFVAAPIDLLSARSGSTLQRWAGRFDWRAWRTPAFALTAAALVALAGLNLHWLALRQESAQLRAQLEGRYRQAFPAVSVIVDPVLQMRRSVAQLQARAGQAAADDFLPLLSRFSLALGAPASDALTALEYRSGQLHVRFRSGLFVEAAARQTLMRNLRQAGLSLDFEAADGARGAGAEAGVGETGTRGTGRAWSAVVSLRR